MDLRLISLNVNSIVAYRRKYLLNDFISKNPAHIYFLQETKFGPNHSYSHPSFSTLSSSNRSGCGGVAIMVHGGFRIRNLFRVSGMIDAVFVDVCVGDEWISFGSVYVHPNCADLDPLALALAARHQFVIGGDLNARDPSFGDGANNRLGGLLIELTTDKGYNLFSPPLPTCFHAPDGSYIDKFMADATPPYPFSPIETIPSFSDHFAISMTVHCPSLDLTVKSGFKLRQFNLVNVTRMNRFLEEELDALRIPTDADLPHGDLERISGQVSDIFSRAVDRFVPSTVVRTNGILLSFATLSVLRRYHSAQRRLHRNIRRGTWSPTLDSIRVEIRLLRQMALNSIGCDLGHHYQNAMANTVSTRHAHRTIRTHTSYRRRDRCPAVIYTDEAKTASIAGNGAVADQFRHHFLRNHLLTVDDVSEMDDRVGRCCTALSNTSLTIPFSPRVNPAILDRASLAQINDVLPVCARDILTSADEVSEVIRLAPSKRSSGSDRMPYVLIKSFSPSVILFLTILFNHLLSTSYFPNCWKHSIITPIPKPSKDPSIISNWRPISNLNCVSKIFERLLARRLTSCIEMLNLFPDQFGFLREHSSVHALGRLHSAICDGLNSGEFTTFVSLDLRAAFDTVWHDALIFKMVSLKFPTLLTKSIQSFLSNRSFSVQLGDVITDPSPMQAGTPQGSVCSPILFNIYLHDIPRDEFVKTIQFADDTSVYATSRDPGRVQCAMNLHLARLSRYFSRWKLLLNERKSVLVVFLGFVREANVRLRRKFQSIAISINGHLLRVETRVRFLGVIFDRNNRFVRHVDHVLGKAKRAFFALRPVLRSPLIEPAIRVNLYRTYVRPVLAYASAVWCRPVCLSSHQMERLRAFERKVLRMAAGVRRQRGSFVYANNSCLHEIARCPRIDRFIVDKAVDFFQKCSASGHLKISSLLDSNSRRIFPELASTWRLSLSRTLLVNDMLLLFHRPYDGSDGRTVYNTRQ